MADIWNILSANYVSRGTNLPSKTPYVAVDPAAYQGNWTGKYSTNEKFSVQISNVNGFRAKARYQSGNTIKYQDVLIKDNSFRIGDTKFTLAAAGQAQIRNAVTDPATGNTSLITGNATQDT